MTLYKLLGLIIMIVPALMVYIDITEHEYTERGKGTITISTICAILGTALITYSIKG